ncbi:hypothetical protein FQZ97_1205890 [compost metagenome]
MNRIFGWKDEDRFRQIEFTRNGLHARVRQPLTVVNNSQWISGQSLIGENVENLVISAGTGSFGHLSNLPHISR